MTEVTVNLGTLSVETLMVAYNRALEAIDCEPWWHLRRRVQICKLQRGILAELKRRNRIDPLGTQRILRELQS